MKHIQLYIILLLGSFISSCDRDSVESIDFNVTIQNDMDKIYAGDEITFNFNGNPDYIAFYSGDIDNNYANKDRTEVTLESLGISCTIKQQYTDQEYRGKEILMIYISEDFSGNYTAEEINKATWTKISGNGYNQIAVPTTVNSSTEEVNGQMDLSEYKDKNFYVAFMYNAPKRNNIPTSDGNGRYMAAPRIDVNPLNITKETEDGQIITMSNAMTEWGFSIVYENSEQQGTYQVNDTGLLFQPQKGKEHTDDDVIVWMVSQLISPSSVSPDRGTAIKSVEAALPSFSYQYNNPGEYTATFIATNANLWNSKQIVKQVKFTVKPTKENIN